MFSCLVLIKEQRSVIRFGPSQNCFTRNSVVESSGYTRPNLRYSVTHTRGTESTVNLVSGSVTNSVRT